MAEQKHPAEVLAVGVENDWRGMVPAPSEAADMLRRIPALEAARDRLLADLRLIAGTDPVDAMLDPDRAVRIAKAAIAATETKEMP